MHVHQDSQISGTYADADFQRLSSPAAVSALQERTGFSLFSCWVSTWVSPLPLLGAALGGSLSWQHSVLRTQPSTHHPTLKMPLAWFLNIYVYSIVVNIYNAKFTTWTISKCQLCGIKYIPSIVQPLAPSFPRSFVFPNGNSVPISTTTSSPASQLLVVSTC